MSTARLQGQHQRQLQQQQQQQHLQQQQNHLNGASQTLAAAAANQRQQQQQQLNNGISGNNHGRKVEHQVVTGRQQQVPKREQHPTSSACNGQQTSDNNAQRQANGRWNGSTSDSSLSSSSSPGASSSSDSSSSGSSTSSSSSSNVTAFLSKLWRMVNDQANGDLIRWSQSGCSFVILNQIQFAKDLLPLYFKHSNMASFIRQLNMYGFRKIPLIGADGSSDQRMDVAQFYHMNFMRDQEQRLSNIKRKNNSCKTHNLIVNGSFCDEVRSILSDVKSIRDGQNSSESILGAIQLDNKSLWRDVAILRNQHHKQRRVIEKLIQFLVSLIQNRKNIVKERKVQLMIEPNFDGAASVVDAMASAAYAAATAAETSSPPATSGDLLSACAGDIMMHGHPPPGGKGGPSLMDSDSDGGAMAQQAVLSELVGARQAAGGGAVAGLNGGGPAMAAASQNFVSSLCQATTVGKQQHAVMAVAESEELQLAAAAVAVAEATHRANGCVSPVSPAPSALSQRTAGSNRATPPLQYQHQFDGRTPPLSSGQRVVPVVAATASSPACSPSPVHQHSQQQRASLLAASNANCQQWSSANASGLSPLYSDSHMSSPRIEQPNNSNPVHILYHNHHQQHHQGHHHHLQQTQQHQNADSINHNNHLNHHGLYHEISNISNNHHNSHLMSTTSATGGVFSELTHRVAGPTAAATTSFLSALEQQQQQQQQQAGDQQAAMVFHNHHFQQQHLSQ